MLIILGAEDDHLKVGMLDELEERNNIGKVYLMAKLKQVIFQILVYHYKITHKMQVS